MKTLTVGELKANFSDVLSTVLKTGEAVVISYGKKKGLQRLCRSTRLNLRQNVCSAL